MKTLVIVIVLIVVIGALLVAGLMARQRKQREGMQQQFGPEYDRTVEQAGDRRTAERELQERTRRHETLQIRPLDPASRENYAQQWRQTQEEFVDQPQAAVTQADVLVAQVMQERGYPAGSFDQQVRDVSVEHSSAVDEYRAAHRISTLNDSGEASTEQLREAMVHYRALFMELLDAGDVHNEGNNDASNNASTDANNNTNVDGDGRGEVRTDGRGPTSR